MLRSVLACQHDCATALAAERGDDWWSEEPLESTVCEVGEIWEPLSDGLSAWDIARMDVAAGEAQSRAVTRAIVHECQNGLIRAVDEIVQAPAARVGIARAGFTKCFGKEGDWCMLTARVVRAWSRCLAAAPADTVHEFVCTAIQVSVHYCDNKNLRALNRLSLYKTGDDICFPTPLWGLVQQLCTDPRLNVLSVARAVFAKYDVAFFRYSTSVVCATLLLALLATQQETAVFGSLDPFYMAEPGRAAPFLLEQAITGGLCDMVQRACAEPILVAGLTDAEIHKVLVAVFLKCPVDVQKRMFEVLCPAMIRHANENYDMLLGVLKKSVFQQYETQLVESSLRDFLEALRTTGVRLSQRFWLRLFDTALQFDRGWVVSLLLCDSTSAPHLENAGALARVQEEATLPCNRYNSETRFALRCFVRELRTIGKEGEARLTALFGGASPDERVFQVLIKF